MLKYVHIIIYIPTTSNTAMKPTTHININLFIIFQDSRYHKFMFSEILPVLIIGRELVKKKKK